MMKKAVAAFLIGAIAAIFMALPSSAVTAADNNYPLKLMTFNVRNLHGDDGTINSWDNRKGIAVNAINQAAPDIIGMQEAFKVQIDYFVDNSSNDLKSIGSSRFGNSNDEYSNILYRADKFNVLQWGQFWLSATPDVPGSRSPLDTSWPRMVTWAKFQAKANNNAVFYFFNTHLGLTEAVREQSAQIILDMIPQIVTSADTPLFFGGDLNCDESSPAYNLLSNSYLTDSWMQLKNSVGQNDGTLHLFTGNRKDRHIDWIFQKNADVQSIEIDYYSENGRFPSDHYPVNLVASIPLTYDDTGFYRIKNRWTGEYLHLQNTTGKAEVSHVDENALASRWKLENAGEGFYRLMNLSNGQYLHIEGNQGHVQYGPLVPGWSSAKWTLPGINGFVHLNNKWKPNQYIHIENKLGYAQSSTIAGPNWRSSHWILEPTGTATFYQHTNFGGKAVVLGHGSYTMAQLQALGISNDDISSLIISGPVTVELYENDNFGGATLTKTAPVPTLSSDGWNDRATSLKIIEKKATFYQDANFSGSATSLLPGEYTLAQLEAAGIANDSITSLKVSGGVTVELFWDDHFTGASLSKTSDVSNLSPDGWNDKASSIKIY